MTEEDADKILIAVSHMSDPLCKVTLEGSSDNKGRQSFEVISFVPESEANRFAEQWKSTSWQSDQTKITITGIKGSYSAHYSNIFSIKIDHM